MEKRRAGLVIAAALLVLLSARHPTANIHIETHDVTDVNPQRFHAAIDVGLVAVKLLVTWTAETVAR